MRHGSLFSGIGGFDLAAEWMGWENVFHCEKDKFCQKILKKHWPKSILHEDITTTDFTVYRFLIDILTGGDPCQPHSVAGKQMGKADERYLWPEYRRAISEILPIAVVNENVRGSISNGILDEKIADMESLGYSWWPPLIIPASSVGANHKRERVWLIAHLNSERMEGRTKKQVLRESDIQIGQIGEPFQSAERRFNAFEDRLCRTLHGVSNGVHRIKALGNAVVPQVVYQIFKAIEQYESLPPPSLH